MKKRIGMLSILLTALLCFITGLTAHMKSIAKINHILETEEVQGLLRQQEISGETFENFCSYEKASDYSRYEYLAAYYLTGQTTQKPLDSYLELVKKYQEENFAELVKEETAIWEDLQYFPIPLPEQEDSLTVSFENSWMFDRSYGGNRGHEGTDIMASLNERGHYPVISMTDGVVEKVGWLELGGYRIGVRSPNGGYFYYAHLNDYARDFQEGDTVKAGELLGFMGDSGYGEEGTVGKFAVHLHMGIYIDDAKGNEISVNPYWVLKWMEPKRLTYDYGGAD